MTSRVRLVLALITVIGARPLMASSSEGYGGCGQYCDAGYNCCSFGTHSVCCSYSAGTCCAINSQGECGTFLC
jgi:hypothetical protein